LRRNTKLQLRKDIGRVRSFTIPLSGEADPSHLGPTCKKMMDLKSADKVFKSSAFEPSDEDIRNYKRTRRNAQSKRYHDSDSDSDIKVKSRHSPSPVRSIPDELMSDSDDDLPDVAHMHAVTKKCNKGKGRAILSDDDDDDVCTFLSDDHNASETDGCIFRWK